LKPNQEDFEPNQTQTQSALISSQSLHFTA